MTNPRDIAAINTALAIVQPTRENYRLAIRRILEGRFGADMATDGMIDIVLGELAAYRQGLKDGAAGGDDA